MSTAPLFNLSIISTLKQTHTNLPRWRLNKFDLFQTTAGTDTRQTFQSQMSPNLIACYLSSCHVVTVTMELILVSMGSVWSMYVQTGLLGYLKKRKTSSHVPVIFLFALFVINMLMNINISILTWISSLILHCVSWFNINFYSFPYYEEMWWNETVEFFF